MRKDQRIRSWTRKVRIVFVAVAFFLPVIVVAVVVIVIVLGRILLSVAAGIEVDSIEGIQIPDNIIIIFIFNVIFVVVVSAAIVVFAFVVSAVAVSLI